LTFGGSDARPPSTILGTRKLETPSYPMVQTVSLETMPECDGQTGGRTDGQTDEYAVAYTDGVL